MFTKITPNHIVSDAGFSVKVVGRTGILYTEGRRSITIDSELLANDAGIAVYTNSIKKWDPPDNESKISSDDAKIIVGNVENALRFAGFDPDIF